MASVIKHGMGAKRITAPGYLLVLEKTSFILPKTMIVSPIA